MLIMALAPGCSPTRGYVMNDWARTLRELGIVPIFPPREDVQVGDVYVYPYNPDGPEAEKAMKKGDLRIGMIPRWKSLNLLSDLKAEYRDRPSWPATPDEYSDILDTAVIWKSVWRQPTTGNSNIFERDTIPNRLRLVGFPDFAATTFTGGEASPLIPIEALNIAFGVNWSGVKSVTVKIPAAESYGLPLATVVKKLLKVERDTPEAAPKVSLMDNMDTASLFLVVDKDVKRVWIRVITEVYYARAIDIAIQSKTQGGAVAAIKPTRVPQVDTTASSVVDMDGSPVDRARELNRRLELAGASTVPGGLIRFVTATDRSVSMRRIWERDIAIGFRGLSLEVDKNTAVVSQHSVAGGVAPLILAE